MSEPENHPGRRLSFSGALCTVRYVGPVEGTKGVWLGVEWDEPSRGKHDGAHMGVRYFDCRGASPTAASFVRPSRPSDLPVSFFEALKNKYASTSAEDITAAANEIHISGKAVEEVGFEKIRRQLAELQELRIVVLDGACIAAVDSHLDEQDLKVVELDLSRNLLESWYDITTICSSLRSLRSLRLDGNTLSRPQDPFKNDESHWPYGRLKELSLNDLGFLQQERTGKDANLSWEFIRKFTALFPSLMTLSLASNNLTEITLPLATLLLTKLDLSSNAFTTLEHIRPLTALPNLQTLSLRANPLTSLLSPSDKGIFFPKLKHLDLTSTLLPTLSSLNPIPESFPELTSLLTNQTPLTTYPSASLHTIARLASLTELNYARITPAERHNAELYYLNQVSKQLATVTDDTNERKMLEEHPRWKALCDMHGEPAITRTNPTDPTGAGTLGARVTEFLFQISPHDLQTARQHAQSIAGHADIPDAALISKKKLIPRTIDVYRLKGIAAQLFAIRATSIRLIWVTDEWDPVGEGDGGWSVSEDDSDRESEPATRAREREWKRREVELVDGTRAVGFFVEGRTARVRVELR